MSKFYKWAYILTGREEYRDLYLAPYYAMQAQRRAKPFNILSSIKGAKETAKLKQKDKRIPQ